MVIYICRERFTFEGIFCFLSKAVHNFVGLLPLPLQLNQMQCDFFFKYNYGRSNRVNTRKTYLPKYLYCLAGQGKSFESFSIYR